MYPALIACTKSLSKERPDYKQEGWPVWKPARTSRSTLRYEAFHAELMGGQKKA